MSNRAKDAQAQACMRSNMCMAIKIERRQYDYYKRYNESIKGMNANRKISVYFRFDLRTNLLTFLFSVFMSHSPAGTPDLPVNI